jgi:hypothetical protein
MAPGMPPPSSALEPPACEELATEPADELPKERNIGVAGAGATRAGRMRENCDDSAAGLNRCSSRRQSSDTETFGISLHGRGVESRVAGLTFRTTQTDLHTAMTQPWPSTSRQTTNTRSCWSTLPPFAFLVPMATAKKATGPAGFFTDECSSGRQGASNTMMSPAATVSIVLLACIIFPASDCRVGRAPEMGAKGIVGSPGLKAEYKCHGPIMQSGPKR